MKRELIIRDIDHKYTDQTIKEIDDKFHGQIILHFAHGIPKKIEYNLIEDIK